MKTKEREKLALRYARLTGQNLRSAEEDDEMKSIQRRFHASREKILLEAGMITIARNRRPPTPEEQETFRKGCKDFRQAVEEHERRRKLN